MAELGGRRLRARLVYDTRSQALPLGIRAVAQHGRRLLYSADEYELLLQVTTDSSPRWLKIIGQLLADGAPVAGARIQIDGRSSKLDQVADEEGEFRLAPLRRGEYRLEIGAGADLLELPPLDLDEAE